MYVLEEHQEKQIEVVDKIDEQIKNNELAFSIVTPVSDFEKDKRICLTGIHLPNPKLINHVYNQIINPLKSSFPGHYYYPKDSLHVTIKSIRVINDPPHFTDEDIEKAEKVFSEVISNHKKFNIYFYRLLLFPYNLALIGTTDKELDNIISELDEKLKKEGVPDDKIYSNSQYFFSNMTLARFYTPVSEDFEKRVKELSEQISFEPYTVDSVSLVTANSVFKNQRIIKSWKLF